MITLEQLTDELKENIELELDLGSLEEWSINSSSVNFIEQFKRLEMLDLEELIKEIEEGKTIELKIDLSASLLAELYQIQKNREREKAFRG